MLELAALLAALADLAAEGDRDRYDSDDRYGWIIQRLWIAAGNEADSYRKAIGVASRVEPWSGLVGSRRILAHRLPEDLNDDRLWCDANEASRVLADVNGVAQP